LRGGGVVPAGSECVCANALVAARELAAVAAVLRKKPRRFIAFPPRILTSEDNNALPYLRDARLEQFGAYLHGMQ
jgi:hypothetical protein